jgi:hypothetical protein
MVPRFRGDNVWTPAFAGVTIQETFYEAIKIDYPAMRILHPTPYTPSFSSRIINPTTQASTP